MPSIIVINKSGKVENLKIKSANVADLYKRAGFKTNDNFVELCMWDICVEGTKYKIHAYGKKVGNSAQVNKYEFPPPIDTTLLYGTVVIVNLMSTNLIGELSELEWNKIYEFLYGGFEDIEDENNSIVSVDELENVDSNKITTDGYLKDDFVVSDAEEEEEENEPLPVVKAKSPTKKKGGSGSKRKATEVEEVEQTNEIEYTSELEEEPYL